jgi:prephenate dehydrogenase
MFKQLGLIGCGLMGSSFALALKHAGLVERVVGFSQTTATTDKARALGVIDSAAASASQAAEGSDLVLISVPVGATFRSFEAVAPALRSDSLLMDVGSTKRDVVAAARQALGDKLACFVPAHPICGKEVSGVEHAEASLYAGKKLILTPLAETGATQLAKARQLWRALTCEVSDMTPEAHDAAYAAVSHLPHLLAFAAMNALASPAGAQQLPLAGSGFRDFTRIAASEPAMWRDILLANRDEVLAQSALFKAQLERLENALHSGDAAQLQALITQASQARAHWQAGHHPAADLPNSDRAHV